MVYLLGTDAADKPAGVRFRDLLDRPGILRMPGTRLANSSNISREIMASGKIASAPASR